MSNIKDQILLANFGLNQDDANRYKDKGTSEYFLNVLKGEDGSMGELTNLKGNRKITYPLGDSNTYFVAWSCYDPLTRNVYAYIFSQPYDVTGSGDYEYDNRFIRFNEDTELVTTMFYDTKNYFGVDPNIRVKDSFVLGDWLFFNPQTSEPKIIDLTMIYNYTTYAIYDPTLTYAYGDKVTYFGGVFVAEEAIGIGEDPVNYSTKWDRIGDSYQDNTDIDFDSELRYAFNQIKHIPVYRPVCIYATDADKNANSVRGKLFRFTYRYKFFDNSYSRYGAYSDITLPQYDELYNGEVPGDLDQFNCIDVIIPLHSSALIKEIDIIFQETGGDWKRTKIINRKDITLLDKPSYTYRFYNTDSAFDVIDDKDFFEPYDALPQKANSMEIISKNILTFGGVTEGFENIDKNDIDVTLTPEIEDIEIPESQAEGGRRRDNLVENDWVLSAPYGGGFVWTLTPASWFVGGGWSAGDIFVITLNEKTVSYTFEAADVLNVGAFVSRIAVFLKANYPTVNIGQTSAPAVRIGTLNADGTQTPVQFSVSVFYEPSGISEVANTKRRGFKTGAWHPFCIYYYDEAMRRWDAQTSKDHPDGVVTWSADGTTVYVPMFGEYSPNDGLLSHKWNINWTINHLPPSEAKWWRWGYAGNALCSYFVQYTVEEIVDSISNSWTGLNITPLQTLKTTTTLLWNQFPQSVITPYAWQQGDRVRVITKASVGTDIGAVIDGTYDYEILKYDETTTEGEYWIYVQDFDYAAIQAGEDTLIEIYRPIKTDSKKLFYEFGELMPIIRDSGGTLVHGCGSGGTQNQDFALDNPAIGTFTKGDVFHILRTPSKPINNIVGYFHESQWYSDFYDSDDWDKGRPGVETQFGQRYLNIVRHSDQYLQNTLINGLSTFRGDKYKELNDVYGDILRIIEIGDTLKVYQRKKPSSILIGRTEYVDADGRANIVSTSERILGALRYSSTDYGTEFPESITRNNRYVYGFDVYNGVMWRDSANGIFPISGRYESTDGGGDYKMETYFKQKSKALLVSGLSGIDVMTVWDERHKNLYVIFKDLVTEANDEAIMFHEPSNKWICFTNMDQTPTEGWNMPIELDFYILRGFENGIGYYFDEDTRFSVFDIPITTPSVSAFPDKVDVTLVLYEPTITCTADVAMAKQDIVLAPLDPTIFVSYVHLSVNTLNFLWTDSVPEAQGIDIDCSPLTATITSIVNNPDVEWLGITQGGAVLSLNSTVADFTPSVPIYFYPLQNNGGGARSCVVTITNNRGDSDSITVTQDAAVWPPIVDVSVLGSDVSFLSITQVVGTLGLNDTTIDIEFNPNHASYSFGQTFTMSWFVWLNGVRIGLGSFTATDGVVNYKELTIVQAALTLETVYVYLSSSVPVVSTTTDVLTTTLVLYEPTIRVTKVESSVSDMTWLGAEFGMTFEQLTVITTPEVNTKILSMPSWITVTTAADLPLYPDAGTLNPPFITDGDIIKIYPIAENTGSELTGTIVFKNIYTDTDSITVTHQAAIPAGTILTASMSVWSGDRQLWIWEGSDSVYAESGSTSVQLIFTPDMPLIPTGEEFTAYWRAYINGILHGSSTFVLNSAVSNTKVITLDTLPIIGDVITVQISSKVFI